MVDLDPAVRRVLAANPGPMTLDGTNTWVLGLPGRDAAIVVDPGPDEAGHRDAVLAAAGSVAAIVLTHWHLDHSAGIPGLAGRTGAPVYAMNQAYGTRRLKAGLELQAPGIELTAYATPGHTRDSASLLVGTGSANYLVTGDMVLGRGTTVIMYPDGDLTAYFSSLDRYAALIERSDVAAILPGHGDVRDDPAGTVRHYRRHRHERLEQVRAAVAGGAATADDVVAFVYADVDRSVWPAARLSVLAQLDYLAANG